MKLKHYLTVALVCSLISSCNLINMAEENAKLDAWSNAVDAEIASEARLQQSADPKVRAAALQRAKARNQQAAIDRIENQEFAAQQQKRRQAYEEYAAQADANAQEEEARARAWNDEQQQQRR